MNRRAYLPLHGTRLVTARLGAVLPAILWTSLAMAQPPTNAPAVLPATESRAQPATQLPEVTVEGRQDSMTGVADSATRGVVGAKELADRPTMRVGEILETIPGVIITQHAGGGKANQYFLRGFNLDHGTDLALDLDGMPLNLPTHAHGQGYADMNIVIPEFVQKIDYEKGPYYTANGDFSSAGAGHLDFYKTLPQNFVTLEGGMYGFERGVFGMSAKAEDGSLLYGAEISHDDGPWEHPDNYLKLNGILTYSGGDAANGYSITAHGYHGKWDSSDQNAESAVTSGLIPLYGALDPTDGGNSQRDSLQAEWHRADENSATKVMVYTFYYDLDLFSDFTYFLVDTNRGDQFEQKDHRIVAGLNASHRLFGQLLHREMENTIGLQVRNDAIANGIYQTQDRVRTDKTDTFDFLTPTTLPAVTRQDDIAQTSAGLFYENKLQWTEKFRTAAGVRSDVYNFNVTDFNPTNTSLVNPANSGQELDAVASPKLSLIFGPWARTEVYLNGGFGYHSNDGRSTTTTSNPPPANAPVFGRVNGLVQTRGAEIGARTTYLPGLQSTFSLWYLHSDSELLFDGDTGDTVASPQPSNRYGVEWANYYAVNHWITLDLDYANSVARFTRPDSDGGENVPEAVGEVLAAGVTFHDPRGFYGSLRLRYFGPRNLISTGAVKSDGTMLVNLGLGYRISPHWSVNLDFFNLLDRHDHDIDYYYESRVTPGSAPVAQIHFHPEEPFQARFGMTATF